MSNYRDPTPIKIDDIPIDRSKLSPEVIKLATFIRQKQHGVDVREAMALALELLSTDPDVNRTNINGYQFQNTNERMNYIEKALKKTGIPIDPEEEQKRGLL